MYYIATDRDSSKVSIWDCSIQQAAEEDGWDREGLSAEEFIERRYFLIPIPDPQAAEKIALNEADFDNKVCAKAWELLSSFGFEFWLKAKKKQITLLVESGDISFAKINDSTIRVSYHGESSEFSKDSDGDWDYDEKVLCMLDIDYAELVDFLLESLGVK